MIDITPSAQPIKETPKELRIEIPSSAEFVGPIMCFLYALFKNKDIDESSASDVVTAVIEAVANAITHGNNADICKKIGIAIYVNQNTLTIEVQDEGQGFDPKDLPDPLSPENMMKPWGRGIFLIKSFMDTVDFDFSNTGTRLIMQKVFRQNLE